jgi:hypothetical protein
MSRAFDKLARIVEHGQHAPALQRELDFQVRVLNAVHEAIAEADRLPEAEQMPRLRDIYATLWEVPE